MITQKQKELFVQAEVDKHTLFLDKSGNSAVSSAARLIKIGLTMLYRKNREIRSYRERKTNYEPSYPNSENNPKISVKHISQNHIKIQWK